ncbi:MAG: MetQ/NlpA family ABC transporter substrate-binding protein [Rectinemataceae bacterium]|jgi:NitT/TauT family transport system substrate-binding protein
MKAEGLSTRIACAALIAALAATAAAAESIGGALKVGVLPDADSLPLLVADAEGLFAAAGATVSLVRFNTAVERDAALQAGAIDGAVSDLLAVALAAQGGFDLRATSLTDGRYGIVASPGSGISSLAGLAGKSIGISSNTIIHYEAETMLARAGLAPAEVRGLAVPKIQLRMELLLAGRLEAACLPEPLLSVAVAKGARLLAASDDAVPGQGLHAGVIVFSEAVLDGRPTDISAFYRAYKRAADKIDTAPDSYRPFLVDKALFPAEVRDSFSFVAYAKPRLPSTADIGAVLAWMRSKGLLKKELEADLLVDGRPIAEASKGW